MTRSVLIIGEDPASIDFDSPDMPPGVTAKSIHDGLNGSRDRLIASGVDATILLTNGADTIGAQVAEALAQGRYDVVVIGAGLRVLPDLVEQFEILINTLHHDAPQARIAFNNEPKDSDVAARRQLG